MGRPFKLAAPALALLLLAGCAGQDLGSISPSEPGAICKALVGPIKYSSTNKKSRRFAGPELAPDLKQRNDIGTDLGCPQYRRR